MEYALRPLVAFNVLSDLLSRFAVSYLFLYSALTLVNRPAVVVENEQTNKAVKDRSLFSKVVKTSLFPPSQFHVRRLASLDATFPAFHW